MSPGCKLCILTLRFCPLTGRRETNAPTIEYGRASQEAVDILLRCHWVHLFNWNFAASPVVGDVHDRRYVLYVSTSSDTASDGAILMFSLRLIRECSIFGCRCNSRRSPDRNNCDAGIGRFEDVTS